MGLRRLLRKIKSRIRQRRVGRDAKRIDRALFAPGGKGAILEARLNQLEHARAGIDQQLGTLLATVRSLRDLKALVDGRHSEVTALKVETGHLRAHIDNVFSDLRSDRDAVASAVTDIRRSIEDIWGRMDLVRKELLFEIKYGASDAQNAAAPARILNRDRLIAAGSELRLNIGCGHLTRPDYINVDFRELPGVDVVADVKSLPFNPGSIAEIYSAHVLEHFPQEELRRVLLPYWHSMLRSGGEFRVIVPDGDAMVRGVAAGSYDFRQFREALFGGQEYEGDYHFNMFTPESLSEMLGDCHFTEIECLERGRRNGVCFEFELRAIKP